MYAVQMNYANKICLNQKWQEVLQKGRKLCWKRRNCFQKFCSAEMLQKQGLVKERVK